MTPAIKHATCCMSTRFCGEAYLMGLYRSSSVRSPLPSCRHGKLTLLQLTNRAGKVWLVDITTMKRGAFTTSSNVDTCTTLKTILEAKGVKKVTSLYSLLCLSSSYGLACVLR